ncbi:MAG TPA: tRNA adenosine(34) deaminase TadA [Myxococcota bacterium]|nr:tRNA adenosine(34) deaminase TadA [Myxococcota bacterium]HRY93434.1 tRNA adenosine(34) deaminase TadA [Myxococcota bacterium]HSA20997.1 tRNA adenosine(34) deaminase TadA [Myxococcota bacterium]
MSERDQAHMQLALEQARLAFDEGEVPVGAVIVLDDRVIAAGRNGKERLRDPTAHAEVLALRQAAERLGRWRLSGCSLLVTLEPCVMCMGAAVSARIERLVFGCADPKAGAARSLYRLGEDVRLNHRFAVEGGLLADEAAELLRAFFRRKRTESVL